MKYKVTVRFSGFIPGEIIDIPDEHDLPQSLFDQGYFEPLEKPRKKKTVKAPEPKKVVTQSTVTTSNPSTGYITYTPTNGTQGSKPDKLD